MKQALATLMLLATAILPLPGQTPPVTAPQISIHVYNYAHASPSTLARAKKQAARILREAGIATSWLDCPTSSEAPAVPACRKRRPANLTVRIIPGAAESLSKFMVGFALPAPEGAIHATVFHSRVLDLADRRLASPHLILGLAIAHEIGHLLLGSEKHSATGLMKGQWTQQDLQLAKVELLRFSRRQAAMMRAEVARRAAD